MRIRKLHWLVLKAFAGPFLASFSVTVFILVLQFMSRYQDQLFGKGFGPWVLGQLFFYAGIQMTVLAFPIAILISSLMTMGRLGERYELAAMKSAGISLFRILRPLVACSIAIAMFSFYTSWVVLPAANLKLYSLLYDVKRTKPELALEPGYFETKIEGYTLYFSNRNPASMMLYNIKIWQHNDQFGNYKVITADSAQISTDDKTLYLRLTLFSGETHEMLEPDRERPTEGRYARTAFDTSYAKLDMSGFGLQRTDQTLFKSHRYMLTVPELAQSIDSMRVIPGQVASEVRLQLAPQADPLKHLAADTLPSPLPANGAALLPGAPLAHFPENQRAFIQSRVLAALRSASSTLEWHTERYERELFELNKYKVELQMRFALPIACVIFLFLGAPIGAIVRKGGLGLPVVISIGFFIIFYTLMTYGRKLAVEGIMPIWFGAWLPVLAVFPVALFVTYQSSTDSRMFDISAYRLGFEAILQRLGIQHKRNLPTAHAALAEVRLCAENAGDKTDP